MRSFREYETSNVSLEMSTVNYLTARSSNLAAFNTIQLNVSTLTGSTIQTTATANTSSIIVSTLATRAATYSTLTGSTITTNSLVLSTLTVSSINNGTPGVAAYSTFNASSITTSSITTSTLTVAPGFNSNISNVIYTSLADSGQTAANLITTGMPATAPSGTVISGSYRATSASGEARISMRLAYTFVIGTTYTITFTGMQGSTDLALRVYQYNTAGNAYTQIDTGFDLIDTTAKTISGSFTPHAYGVYTGTIIFFIQALSYNPYVNFTAFSMTAGGMNVGIGTASPGAILQVRNGNASYTTPTVSISDGTADNVGTYGMINLTRPVAPGDNKGHISLISFGNRVGLLGYINNTPTMGWVSANSMNSSNGIFLNSSGNVSIGTVTSTAKLTISGTQGGEIAHFLSGSGGANMWFGFQGSIRDAATILWRQIGTGSTANYLGIGAHSVDDILNVAATGRVGIGITNPAQTLDVNGTIARSGLKLPRFDYGTVGPATSISIPILFSDTQYNVVEIRFRYEVSAITDINMSATSTTPATMMLGEVGLTIVKYNAQSAPVYWNNASTTSFIFASNVEMVGTGGNLMFRIVRSIGSGGAGQRNHYCYDNVYCWSGIGTARGYGQGHIDNTGVGGPALAYLNLICVSGNINGNWSTTHYN